LSENLVAMSNNFKLRLGFSKWSRVGAFNRKENVIRTNQSRSLYFV